MQQTVQAARTTDVARIVVTGKTDTVGSMAYSQRLSERPADAVKGEMVREGLNANDIVTVGRNFAEPLVQTGPGA